MTDARQRSFWHRAGPIAALGSLLIAAAANEGCGGGMGNTGGSGGTGGTTSSSTSTTDSTTSSTTNSTTSSTTSSTSTGFMGMLGTAADAFTALDATPDPAGTKVYFTAVDATTLATGVYSAPADGSSTTPTAVQTGAPFAAPFGITVSTDGKNLYVADPGATDPTSKKDHGVIFSLPAGGGTPAIIAGTEGAQARSVDLVAIGGTDTLFFTGTDKTDGSPGVFKMPAAGGTITVVAKGAPFNDPSGLAVASDGSIYVADTVAAATRHASIIKIDKTGTAALFFPDLRVGYPAGVALSQDEKTLFVSSIDPVKFTDQLLQIDVSNGTMTGAITMNVNAFSEAAGLHRAHGADVFAWADSSAGTTGPSSTGGKVFVIK